MARESSDKGAGTRAAAARVVHAVVQDGRSLDAALESAEAGIDESERSLLRALSYGVLRHHWRLRAIADSLIQRPLRSRDRVVYSLLLVGLFQLLHTRISRHAAVTLTVEAARRLRRPALAPLVNAVLRNHLRRGAGEPPAGDLEARYDHPRWLIDLLRSDWPDDWQDILRANNERAPMWLRVNARRSSVRDYLGRLEPGAETLQGIPQAIRLAEPCPVDALPGFADGDVSIQDAAAQLAAPWLLDDDGRRLLDLCAAPGGKAAHLLELCGPDSSLTAVDIDRERASRIEETMRRLGLEADVRVADAADTGAWWDGEAYDRVLLDAPCSATGVIRRHPDIKHLRRRADIEALADLQRCLLDAAWTVLGPGGRLLYVTCSVLRDENDRVIDGFLRAHPDAHENLVLPNNNIHALMSGRPHGFQVLPGTDGLDGFYFACLEKLA
jgi:16S rRNA (cytosine967-C5)-methyltransferase